MVKFFIKMILFSRQPVGEEKLFDINNRYILSRVLKFEEIILETQIQLGKMFGDFVWVVAIKELKWIIWL